MFDLHVKEKEQPQIVPVVTKMNKFLEDAKCEVRIVGMSWSLNGNPVIVVQEGQKAEVLVPAAQQLLQIIYPKQDINLPASAMVDHTRYRAKINLVPVMNAEGGVTNPTHIWQGITTNNPKFRDVQLACAPSWLGNMDSLRIYAKGSILILFTKKEDLDEFVQNQYVMANYSRCEIFRYKERTPILLCLECGSLKHCSSLCRKPKCLECGSNKHTTSTHPKEEPAKCINCKGPHPSNDQKCPHQIKKVGPPTSKSKAAVNPKAKESPKEKQPAMATQPPNPGPLYLTQDPAQKPIPYGNVMCPPNQQVMNIEGKWVPSGLWIARYKREIGNAGKILEDDAKWRKTKKLKVKPIAPPPSHYLKLQELDHPWPLQSTLTLK